MLVRIKIEWEVVAREGYLQRLKPGGERMTTKGERAKRGKIRPMEIITEQVGDTGGFCLFIRCP